MGMSASAVQSLLAMLLVGAACGYLALRLWRTVSSARRAKTGAGCGCSSDGCGRAGRR